MALTNDDIRQIRSIISEELNGIDKKMDKRLCHTNKRFDDIEKKIDRLYKNLESFKEGTLEDIAKINFHLDKIDRIIDLYMLGFKKKN